MKTEKKLEKPALGRFRAVDHAVLFLLLQLFSHLHALLVTNSLYNLDDDKPLKWNAVKQLQLISTVFCPRFSLLLLEVFQPLHIERSAVDRLKLIDLENDGNIERPPATSANLGLSPGGAQSLTNRAEAPLLGSVHIPFVKNRISSTTWLGTDVRATS